MVKPKRPIINTTFLCLYWFLTLLLFYILYLSLYILFYLFTHWSDVIWSDFSLTTSVLFVFVIDSFVR